MRWGVRLLLLFLVVDLFYLAVTWPDWNRLATGPIPKTAFMREYESDNAHNGRLARIYWQPVPLSLVPKYMQRAVIVAEDSRFYEHSGFDLIAFKEAMDYNFSEGRLAIGASTISQQTVKNLFLSSSRTPLRKWHELILTWGMERQLKKSRILEIYLNIVEFGPGVYGVQAASQAYWGLPISKIGPRQAAELAATLPSPLKNNPQTRTQQFEKRTGKILRLLLRHPGDAAESLSGVAETLLPDDEDTADAIRECTGNDCPVGPARVQSEDDDAGADE
jgi:monofunctional glycosyltransferase